MDRLQQLSYLNQALLAASPSFRGSRGPAQGRGHQRRLFAHTDERLPPWTALGEDFWAVQDAFLTAEREAKGVGGRRRPARATRPPWHRPVAGRHHPPPGRRHCQRRQFHFPPDEAARIAVETVIDFLQTPSSIQKVIFNVFKDTDADIYRALLGSNC